MLSVPPLFTKPNHMFLLIPADEIRCFVPSIKQQQISFENQCKKSLSILVFLRKNNYVFYAATQSLLETAPLAMFTKSNLRTTIP